MKMKMMTIITMMSKYTDYVEADVYEEDDEDGGQAGRAGGGVEPCGKPSPATFQKRLSGCHYDNFDNDAAIVADKMIPSTIRMTAKIIR